MSRTSITSLTNTAIGRDVTGIILDMIDGVLLGIPSSAFLADRNYNTQLEIAELEGLYNALQQSYNNDADLRAAIESRRADLVLAKAGTSPLGAWRQKLDEKYRQLGDDYQRVTKRMKDTAGEMTRTSNSILKKRVDADRQRSFSGVLKAAHGGSDK